VGIGEPRRQGRHKNIHIRSRSRSRVTRYIRAVRSRIKSARSEEGGEEKGRRMRHEEADGKRWVGSGRRGYQEHEEKGVRVWRFFLALVCRRLLLCVPVSPRHTPAP
jgi:hypothetical protein